MLNDREKQELVSDIKRYYDSEDSLKVIFNLHGEIFGDNFYGYIAGDNFYTKIVNLVRELIKRNKLDNFIEIVRETYPDFAKSLICIALKRCLDELISILDVDFEKNKEILVKAYQKVKPPIGAKNSPKNSTELINNLNRPKGEQPYTYIEKFVGYLLETQSELSSKTELSIWANANIKEYEKLREQIIEEEQERTKLEPCLLVAISSLGNRYLVEGWLIKNLKEYNRKDFSKTSHSTCEQIIINDSYTDKSLTGVENMVRALIQECINITDNNPQEIHIFLPYELMNHPVECWTTYENEDETIGELYAVIIRCSQGLRGKNPRLVAWRKKGEKIESHLGKKAKDIFYETNLKEEKALENFLKQEDAIAVRIIAVFQQEQPGELLWKAAVPLALWIRQQLDNETELEELVKQCCLQKLPKEVKKKRLAPPIDRIRDNGNQTPENHVGRHLCLLWDDPNLLPPEQLLTEITL